MKSGLSVAISTDLLSRISELCNKKNLNRSHLFELAVRRGLDILEDEPEALQQTEQPRKLTDEEFEKMRLDWMASSKAKTEERKKKQKA